MEPRICIIGAGISGLSVGHQLTKAGLRPVIFEKEPFVGGRTGSETVQGFVIDKGAYTLPEFHTTSLKMIRELGLEKSLEETSGTSSTFDQGKEYPIKIGDPIDFMKYKLLSFKNKKDMVKLFLYATSLGKALNLNHPSEKTFELEKESAAEFLLREYDEEILEKIAYPVFCEIFLGAPENNSKAAFLATVRNLTRFKIFSLREGLGAFAEALGSGLDVRLNSPVVGIRETKGEDSYQVQTGGETPQSLTFDAVVFAAPAPILPEVFEELPVSFRDRFREIPYAPSMVVAIAFDQSFPKTSFINNLLRKDFTVLGTLVVDHHKGSRRTPPRRGLVTAILGEKASRDLFDSPDAVISKETLKEIDTLFPGCSTKVIFSKVYRWKYGAVQLKPGILQQQTLTRQAWEDYSRNLYLASDDLCRSSIEVQVRTGIRVADQIVRKYSA